MKYFQKFREELTQLDEFGSREIVGCTAEEIAALEALHPSGKPLPLSLKEFLSLGGKRIAYLQPTTGFYYPKMLEFTQDIKDRLENNYIEPGAILLPNFPIAKDVLVFMEHLAYSFRFIRLGEGDDPPVYFFDDGMQTDEERVIYSSFSESMYELLEDFKDAHNQRIEGFPELQQPLNKLKTKLFDILDFFDQHDIPTGNEDWVNFKGIYGLAFESLYELYDVFNPDDAINIGYYLSLHRGYDEDEEDMGEHWGRFYHLMIDIENMFKQEIEDLIVWKKKTLAGRL